MGFIGFGEAPRYIAGGLSKERARLLAYDVQAGDDTPRARILRRRAEETGVTLVKSLEELLSAADVVLNFTSADAAAPIAHLAAPLLKERKTYLDMNSTSPGTKQALADIFSDSAGDFVEAAVMSSVPAGGARVPISLCGKTGAEVSARLNALGMNTTFLGEEIGQACGKSVYQIIYWRLHRRGDHCPGLFDFLRFRRLQPACAGYVPFRRHHELAVCSGNNF